MLVVTTNDLPGYRVVKHLGVVRGLTVRSRSIVGNIGAAFQIFFGGNITLYTQLAEQARAWGRRRGRQRRWRWRWRWRWRCSVGRRRVVARRVFGGNLASRKNGKQH
jgi:hypothetical protein